jgi:ring-1,2-phenylacetyl-CoA epoxidase subunit PaaE
LAVRPDLPYSCKTGVCATCRAQVVSGRVRMERTWALSPEELASGFVLTCQATPVGDKVTVDFDAL